MDPLLSFSASKLARMIRDREVTSREVVSAHIRRTRRVYARRLAALPRTPGFAALAYRAAIDLGLLGPVPGRGRSVNLGFGVSF